MRYFIEIAYLGKNFHGWQLQENAVTIQGEIEKAFSTIFKEKVQVHGSSRTDAGVHARQQFAHFDFHEIDCQELTYRLNRFLNPEIAVKGIYPVSEDAHSRFDATGRKYIYRIIRQKDPFKREVSALYSREVDLELLNKAAEILFEYRDFQCFSKVKTDVYTYNCEIREAKWVWNKDTLEFHISADRFLRGMVRAIVGTILDVGYEKITLVDFRTIIEGKDRRNAGMAAKAEGLTLERVFYPENYFKHEN